MTWASAVGALHASAALAFLAAGAIGLARRFADGRPGLGVVTVLAAAAAALWAAFASAGAFGWSTPPPWGVFDGLRQAAMLAALAHVVLIAPNPGNPRLAPIALAFGLAAMPPSLDFAWGFGAEANALRAAARVAVSAGALTLAAALAASERDDWGHRAAAFAISAFAAYDLALALDATFAGRFDPTAVDVRAAIALAAAAAWAWGSAQASSEPAPAEERSEDEAEPRSAAPPKLGIDAAAIACALTIVVAVAWLAWRSPEDLGVRRLAVVAVIAFGAVTIAARSARASALAEAAMARETFVAAAPRDSRYDYREIWSEFVDRVAFDEPTERDGLADRLVRAVAQALDAPGGALWRQRRDGAFVLIGSMNYENLARTAPPNIAFSSAAVEHGEPIDLSQDRPYELPEWVPEAPQAWLMLPLARRGALEGVMVLKTPADARALDEEDRALLRALGRQAASYLAEDALAGALAEAREFAGFNRKFAFVMHDLKNIAGQLSLAASNAKRRRGDPEYQEAMIETVEDAAKRVEGMIDALKKDARPRAATVELGTTLANVIGRRAGRKPSLEPNAEAILVEMDVARFEQAINNLVDNAFEASEGRAHVVARARAKGDWALVEVGDNGPGMDEKFIAEKLFAPFQTSKPDGMGLGVFEARDFAENAGGRLEALSAIGRGTVMRIHLPRARRGAPESEPVKLVADGAAS